MKKRAVLLSGILFFCLCGQAVANIYAYIDGYISYKGCRDGEIQVVAFRGPECYGDEEDSAILNGPGLYPPLTVEVPGEYSICACMDVNGNGSCGMDETEPRERYAEVLNLTKIGPVHDIDIALVDPVPCPTPAPTLSPAGTVTLMVLLIGSAILVIKRRKRSS